MQIGSVGLPTSPSPISQPNQPESAERGPDHDNDGDEGSSATAAPPPASTGRATQVDLFA